jgi:hypothetical protein
VKEGRRDRQLIDEKSFVGERVINRRGNRRHRSQAPTFATSLDPELGKGRWSLDVVDNDVMNLFRSRHGVIGE